MSTFCESDWYNFSKKTTGGYDNNNNKEARQCAFAHKVHPHFWHKCLPKEEQIEDPQKFKYLKKNSKKMCMNKKMASNANNAAQLKMPH